VALTRQLLFACEVVGITVHEHLIIGDNRYFSFADQGMIRALKEELAPIGAAGKGFSAPG
jgi:DNA repair protein RadC